MPHPHRPEHPFRVLVVGDHRLVDGLRVLLIADDVHVTFARTPAEALTTARDHEFDLALVTLDTEAGEGSRARALELIALLREDSPSLSIVAVGPPGSSELASDARRLGARDVVSRPWDGLRMLTLVRAQAELGRSRRRLAALETENRELRSRDVVGAPPPLMKVREMEEELVQQAIAQHHGNVSRAARTLGLSRTALYRRLARHEILPSGRRKRGGVAD